MKFDATICLCTCNGGDYIEELLASLSAQTTLPDQLAVFDDASSDDTCERVENFANSAPFQVVLRRNAARMGVRRNFEQAIQYCSGDLIFLCDQDDVWQADKLARYVESFRRGAAWVCGDASVVDQNLKSLRYTLWDRVGFSKAERRQSRTLGLHAALLKRYVVAGATLAFRTEHRVAVLPIPETWLYDAWLAAVLAGVGPGAMIEEPVQLYRQHDGNAIGAKKKSWLTQFHDGRAADRKIYYQQEIARWVDLERRLATVKASPDYVAEVGKKLDHLWYRAALPENRLVRLPKVVSEVLRGGYARYARNWGSIALDLLIR